MQFFPLKTALILVLILALANSLTVLAQDDAAPPNIVYMMLDEIGYYGFPRWGHELLQTPNIDQLSADGMRFTQCLAGGPVCGPTRCVLLTGKHMGHCQMRTNGGGTPITRDEFTLGEMFKSVGYATGGFGKWGIGDTGTTGAPELHGFDLFYGYYHQVHAHSYYPEFMVRNGVKEPLEGNTGDPYEGETFSQYLIHDEAMGFIRENADKPFFCYLPYTLPHGLWGIPEDDPSWQIYKDMDLGGKGQRRDIDPNIYAAMVHMADRQLGDILDLLEELDIDDNTIVVFSGDNGGQAYFQDEEHPAACSSRIRLFSEKGREAFSKADCASLHREVAESNREAGSTTDHLCYFGDVMPTLAEAVGAGIPNDIDGLSFLPTLTEEGEQRQHEYLYWEYGKQVAVRKGNWKAYAPSREAWQLYNLEEDSFEANDLAEQHPDVLREMIEIAEAAHIPATPGGWIDNTQQFTRPGTH